MKTTSVSLLATLFVVPVSLSLAACSSGSDSVSGGDRGAHGAGTVSQDGLCSATPGFAGTYAWHRGGPNEFGDYERLSLDADGRYTAQVEAALVDPDIRCIHAPCTVPESGTWCADEAAGELQLRPSTGSVRTSSANLERGVLELIRGETTSILVKEPEAPASACAAILCHVGSVCTVIGGEATCVEP